MRVLYLVLISAFIVTQAIAQSVSPISPGAVPESAVTTDGGNMPTNVKVVAGKRGSTAIPLTLDESDRLRVDATVSEVATAAEEAALPALLKVVAGKRGSSVISFEFDEANRLKVDAAVTEVATSADGGALPALTKVVAGYDGANVQALATDSSGNIQADVLTQPARSHTTDSVALGDGTETVNVNASNELQVRDDDANTSLSSIDGKFGSLGQKAMAGSAPVVIASDQSAVPISNSNLDAALSTLATEATLSAASAKLPATLGQKTSANSLAVVLSSDQSAITVNSTAQGKNGSPEARHDYSSVNVTTGAYVELVASTSAAATEIEIFDSSGRTLVLATGAAASEVDQVYIVPGGNGRIPLSISAGTRLSVKAVSATADAGELVVNLYGP